MGLQAIIDRARLLSKQKDTTNRLKRVENGLGYAGISFGALAVVLGILYKFSALSKLSALCSGLRWCQRTQRHESGGRRRRRRTSSASEDSDNPPIAMKTRSSATITEILEDDEPQSKAGATHQREQTRNTVQVVPIGQGATQAATQMPQVALVPIQAPQGMTIMRPMEKRVTPEGWQLVQMPWGNQGPIPQYQATGSMMGW